MKNTCTPGKVRKASRAHFSTRHGRDHGQSGERLSVAADVDCSNEINVFPVPHSATTRVVIRKEPDADGNWGDLIIKRGLKQRARKRVLQIDEESKPVLDNLIAQFKCRHVFSHARHPDQKLQPWVLESEMGRSLREKLARDKIKVDPDAGLLCATRF
jgi:hypothetical protein